MESNSSHLIAILSLIFVSSIIWIKIKQNKSQNQLKNSLNELALQNNSNITKHEICGEIIIGLDVNSKSLFFLNVNKENPMNVCINLNEYKKTNVIKKHRQVQSKEGNYSTIEKLILNFEPINKTSNEFNLEVYNLDKSLQINGELQLVEKWSKVINEAI